jgi:hypothetical protein
MAKTKAEIIKDLYKEIERKDKQIDRLKEENSVLMKTALRAEERLRSLQDLVDEKLR